MTVAGLEIEAAGETQPRSALKALIVDDSAADAELLVRQLTRDGFDVEWSRVDNAADLRNALQQDTWGVILCDFSMPGFGGPEALQILRGTGKDVPFILVTGAIGEEAAVDMMKAGAQDFVLKGRISRLGPVLDRELREAQGRRQQRIDLAARVEAQRQLEVANLQLRQLSSKMIQLQENERALLSRGLHDDVGQSLTGLTLQLQALRLRVRELMDTKPLDDCLQIVGHLLTQVRELSLDLRPPQLDQLGLVAALRWFGERKIAPVPELGLRFECEELPALGPDVETAAFRIVQEALTNVLRHSGATEVAIEVRFRSGQLCVAVEDNGRGFDVHQVQERALRGESLGVLNIQERASMAGGRAEFFSRPGRTRVSVYLPRGLT
ncbi:MAG: hypothetical protein RLZZ200_2158 [Pseudomonadota bacterium]|jgi:signal transduction histidine kinase